MTKLIRRSSGIPPSGSSSDFATNTATLAGSPSSLLSVVFEAVLDPAPVDPHDHVVELQSLARRGAAGLDSAQDVPARVEVQLGAQGVVHLEALDPQAGKQMLNAMLQPWHDAVSDPAAAQEQVLGTLLQGYAWTEYGQEHNAAGIESDYSNPVTRVLNQ